MTSTQHVKLTVYCDADHVIGEYIDTIGEKYPFFCDECNTQDRENDKRTGKYPWRITTEIIEADVTDLTSTPYRAPYDIPHIPKEHTDGTPTPLSTFLPLEPEGDQRPPWLQLTTANLAGALLPAKVEQVALSTIEGGRARRCSTCNYALVMRDNKSFDATQHLCLRDGIIWTITWPAAP